MAGKLGSSPWIVLVAQTSHGTGVDTPHATAQKSGRSLGRAAESQAGQLTRHSAASASLNWQFCACVERMTIPCVLIFGVE